MGEDERVETLAHLDACESCQLAIEELAAGSQWWGDLRRLGEPAPGPTLSMGDRLEEEDTPKNLAPDFLEPPASPGHAGRFGPYDVIAPIGRGGMGIVLKAFDPALHRLVAIKVLAPELAANAAARRRFLREARAAASVVHDHVITIHAVAETRGLPYLVMAYVKGMSLQERIDQTGPLATEEILRIGMQAAQGLAAAHAQGLVHRDIKPANILLENGVERVKLTDFGLARAVDDASLTQSGVVAGTPQYMAPEQARGESVDHRADLFSLGSVLYAMCTGRSPFRAETAVAVLRRVSDDTPRPVREVNPEIPEWLAELVAQLHAKDPAARFQSAAEVAERLARHLAAHQGAPPTSPSRIETCEEIPPAKIPPRRSSGRLRLAAAAMLLLLGSLGAFEAAGVTHVAGYLTAVLRIPVQDGTLIVAVDDPGVRVEVDGKAIAIRGAGVEEIRLHPGAYTVEATRDGVPVFRELVTIDRGGKRVVQVGIEGPRPITSASHPARPTTKPIERGPSAGKVGMSPRVTMPAQGTECSTVAFSPDGSKLAAAYGNGTVILWNPADGRAVRTLEGPLQFVSSVAFSPDGRTLASGTGYWTHRELDGLVDLWDVADGRHRARCRGHKGPVYCVAFAPDGRTVASGGVDGTPRIWDVAGGRPLSSLPGQPDWIFAIAYAPDGKTVAIGNTMAVRLLDPATGREKGLLEGHRGQVEAVAFSPDGRTLASGGRDRLIKLWDAATLRERATLAGHAGWVTSLAFSPDGSTLAAAGLEGDHSKEVRLWDAPSGRMLATLPGVNSHSVAFAPDGRSIATGDLSGAVQVWDVAELLKAGANR
jgi:serine/threonine protein kinase